MNKLDELQRLCDAATPAPWRACGDILKNCAAVSTDSKDLFYSVASPITRESADDAKFIAAARTYMPLLIDVARASQQVAAVAMQMIEAFDRKVGKCQN